MTVVEDLAQAILGLRLDRPTRALVDGRSASGKSTFSAALSETLARSGRQVLTVHFDDFHPVGYRARGSSAYTPGRYLEAGFEFAAFERLVLAPTSPVADHRVALSLPDEAGESPTAVLADDGVLLVEGAFLLKPALRSWWDFAIWLDISFETMTERAVARDVAWVGDPTKVRERYESFWRETHSLYEACGAREAAHAVINNENPADPFVTRWSPTS